MASMLHWLAGSKVQDTGDVDATGYIEPPETPAPVFAVRAFRHAIFGTPGTVQPKTLRRHSNTDNGKSRPNARPAMTRPKSSGDTYTLGVQDGAAVSEAMPLPSPTKGILMTPGTAAARRKTVSFGAHVQDNEGRRQGKSGLPDSCPGKFPSPFVKSVEAEEAKIETADRSRGRNKLTEKLEQVREESAKRKSVSCRNSIGPVKGVDAVADFDSPGAEHWRLIFEQYRERSERECRKLVSKQRAAKSFAREKDMQLMETADQLRQEKKKVDRLERQLDDLQAQLMEYQEKLRVSQSEVQSAKEEASRSKRGSGLTGYRRQGDGAAATSPRVLESEKPHENTLKSRASRGQLLTHEPESTVAASKGPPGSYRGRARPISKANHDDAWAPPSAASSLIPTKPDILPPSSSPRAGRTSTNKAPLKPMNVNTLPQESLSIALSMGLQPQSPQRETRSDSPMHSPIRSRPKLKENLAITVPVSSTFLPDGENERPNVLTGTPVLIRSPVLSTRCVAAPTVKEGGSPTLKVPRRPRREDVESKTSAQIEVNVREKAEVDRIARSRLAARGRAVS